MESLRSEYVRSLNCNYERILLEERPKEARYQYGVLGRGEVRFLLPCSLRYIDGKAYLYYDITSTQNLVQLFDRRSVDRQWMGEFFWCMEQLREELDSYLLEERCVLWEPEHIYLDLEKKNFFFLYVPYYMGETGFGCLLDHWVEHVDYKDEGLVEFVYGAYEAYRELGEGYLHRQIFEDFKAVGKDRGREAAAAASGEGNPSAAAGREGPGAGADLKPAGKRILSAGEGPLSGGGAGAKQDVPAAGGSYAAAEDPSRGAHPRRGMFSLFEGRRKKQTPLEQQLFCRQEIGDLTEGRAVGEGLAYGERDVRPDSAEFGRTVYIEETAGAVSRGLYRENGETAYRLEKLPLIIGKKQGEVDLLLTDRSVSRIHAKFLEKEGKVYVEDLNSTNGTYKNGLRLQPYEKRPLETGDELCFGKERFIYRFCQKE